MIKFKESSDCSVCILDSTGLSTMKIRDQLVKYKTRWQESLAEKICIIKDLDEASIGSILILPSFKVDSIKVKSMYQKIITIDAVSLLTHYDLRRAVLETKVKYTKDLDEAKLWLDSLPNTFAYDSETTGLLHPSVEEITMFSFSISESEAFVLSNEPGMRKLVMDFLTTTNKQVVIHNASFDMKYVYHYTKKFIKNYEDSSLLAKVYKNHTNSQKAMVGLKGLAGHVYSQWAVSSDLFGIQHKYNPELIEYSGIDAMATLFVWNEFNNIEPEPVEVVPFEDIFPIALPTVVDARKTPKWFYRNVANPLVKDMIKIMLNGIQLDNTQTEKLGETIDDILEDVNQTLLNNRLVKEFIDKKEEAARLKKVNSIAMKKVSTEEVEVTFKPTDIAHRSYLVLVILEPKTDLDFTYMPSDLLPNGELKWSVNDLKKFIKNNPNIIELQYIVDKEFDKLIGYIHLAINRLKEFKVTVTNSKLDLSISNCDVSKHRVFNPSSPIDKQNLFSSLGITSEKISSKTGNPTWDRDEIERVQRETLDKETSEICLALIDHSNSAIIRNNFLKAFKTYSVDGRLHGNFKLLGAKSARLTSDSPNMLNAPSSKSKFAKPLKKCFVAKEGFVVMATDYSSLQEVTIANITKDKNKVAILSQGLDSHCLHTGYYWKNEVEKHLGLIDDTLEFNQKFKAATKTIPELDELRSKSKGPSFALAFNCQPGKIASLLKIPYADAQAIWDTYHFDLYPGVSAYRDGVVLDEARRTGALYMGLGLSIKTDNPNKDIRTLANVYAQFYDIITLLVLPQIHKQIELAGYEEDILVTSTIYDSIYFEVRKDPKIIKWLNDTLVPIMVKAMFDVQPVPNKAALDIGNNWAELTELPLDATEEYIEEVLKEL